jgi:hypothetical protein
MYEISTDNLHMNGTHIDTHNPIFEALQKFTQDDSTHTSPTLPHPSPTRYSINTEVSILHTHNVYYKRGQHHALVERTTYKQGAK